MFFLTAFFRLRSARGSFCRWSRCCFRRRGRGGSRSRRRSYVSRSWLRSRRRSHVSRGWLRSRRRSHVSRSCWSLRSLSWGRGHMSRACWCLSRRRGHMSRSRWSLRSLSWGRGHMSRTCWSLSRGRGHSTRTWSWLLSPWMGWSRGVTMESFLPLSSLPMLVLFKKFLVITADLAGGCANRDTLAENADSNQDVLCTTSATAAHTMFRVSRYRWEDKRNTGPSRIGGRKSNTGCHSRTNHRCNRPTAYWAPPRVTHKDPTAAADTR